MSFPCMLARAIKMTTSPGEEPKWVVISPSKFYFEEFDIPKSITEAFK